MVCREYIATAACLTLPLYMQAQFVDYGADPPRYKWNTAKLEHYTLIYPQELDSMAYRYALYLENIYPHVRKTMNVPKAQTFPVVLHPGSMLSNGMVAWAPQRMELLTTPYTRQYGHRWDKHLTLHESRHVFQTGALMRGVFKPLYYLIGEQAAGVASCFLPAWFFEGDAVGTETALSYYGRGRMPEFNMVYRAHILSGSFYAFDKWYLGSYKDYTGDYYALGYDLTAFARYRYGKDIWSKALSRYANHPVTCFPFGNAFKHYAGTGINELFRETFAFLKEEWMRLDSGRTVPDYLSPERKEYISYQYPQALNDSTVVAVKTSLSDIQSLTAITGGKEKRLTYMGSLNGRTYVNAHGVYWMEYVPGLRWAHENFTVLKQYDAAAGRVKTLFPYGRYISAALNDSIVALSLFTEEGESRIVVRNAGGGKECDYSVPCNAFAKELELGGDGAAYVAVICDSGTSLLRLDLSAGAWSELLPPTQAGINSPVWNNGRLYFESGLNGTNNIYYIDLRDGQAYRITSARFGAFHPAFTADGKRLLYSDYQAKGYRLASIPADSLPAEKADFACPYRFPLAETLSGQEEYRLDTAALQPVDFRPRPYRKASHLFHIHSWAPFYYSASEVLDGSSADFTSAVYPGFSLFSQNALNTAVTQAGWYYNGNSHHARLNFTYTGLLPVINIDIDYGGKAADIKWESDTNRDIAVSARTGRNKVEAKAQVYIPFNLTRNHYIRGIQPSLSYYFTNHRIQQYDTRHYSNYQYVLAEMRFYNYLRMAQRDILPRLGYQVYLQYLTLPFNTGSYGNLYAAKLVTYWPGLMPNHSLMLRFGYQYQSAGDKPFYVAVQLLERMRGHDDYPYQSIRLFAGKADYAFSILCPDVSIGSLMYIRRIRANLFFDSAFYLDGNQDRWRAQGAYGCDIIFDWNIFRIKFPLSAGIRMIQPVRGGRFQAETLLSVSY
ncbi:MAG: hypothetical protein MdMp024_1676 [Bacteroidales bacterium]